jgi:hypothetical protein
VIRICLAIGLVAASIAVVAEDRVLVKFYDGSDTNLPPAGWPATTQKATNSVVETGWHTNMTVGKYMELRSARQSMYNDWASNHHFIASAQARALRQQIESMEPQIESDRRVDPNDLNQLELLEHLRRQLRYNRLRERLSRIE